jgi:hypothetical protein
MRRVVLFAFLAVTFAPASAAAAADFTVTPMGMTAYLINGKPNPPLTLVRGGTYTFDVNSPGHPFFIKTVAVTGTGSTFDEGVVNNGTTSGTLTFTVPTDAPAGLFYQCSVHTPMNGAITLPAAPVPASGWLGAMVLALALSGAGFFAYRRVSLST